jgi:NAD(P)H-dependent FMN reductase
VVKRLQDVIHRADAIVFASPEYAGALPGSFKNLRDWSIGDEHADSLYEKPVGWINASPRAAAGAYTELRTVLGYAHARVIDAVCIRLSVTTGMIGPDGRVSGEALRSALSRVAEILTSIVRQSTETTFEIGMP